MFGWAAEELIGQPIERLIPSRRLRRHEPRGRPGPRRHTQGRIHVSDRSHPQSRSDAGRRTRIRVRDRHHRTPARRGGPSGAHDRTGIPDDATESDGVGPDARRAPCARADRQDAARWAPAAPGHRGALNLEQQLKRENEVGAAPSELLSEAKQQLDEAIGRRAVAERRAVSSRAAAFRTSRRPDVAGELDARQIQAECPDRRRPARRFRAEGCPHAALRVGQRASLQRGQTRADGSSHAGVGARCRRSAVHHRDGSGGWVRAGETGRSIEGRPGGLGAVPHPRAADAARRPLGHRQRARKGDSGPPRRAARRCAGHRRRREREPRAPTGAASAVDDDRASPDALRILIVDDHPAVRRALREMLHQRPQLSVVGDASNGFEAIAHAHTLRPDVILMDVAMPHMDGVEATARIRTELPDIRILGVSMLARNETADAIEHAGAAELLRQGDRHATVDRSPAGLSRIPRRRRSRGFVVVPTRPRVLLVDDHPGVVKALGGVLSTECDVVGVVADGREVADAPQRGFSRS